MILETASSGLALIWLTSNVVKFNVIMVSIIGTTVPFVSWYTTDGLDAAFWTTISSTCSRLASTTSENVNTSCLESRLKSKFIKSGRTLSSLNRSIILLSSGSTGFCDVS